MLEWLSLMGRKWWYLLVECGLNFQREKVDEEPYFSITLDVVGLIWVVALLAGIILHNRSVIHCPTQVEVFTLHLMMFRTLFWWACNAANIVSHFLKMIYSHICGEGVMWITPILFYEVNLIKKWKMFFFEFYMIKWEQGGRGELTQCYAFLHRHCISFGVRKFFEFRNQY